MGDVARPMLAEDLAALTELPADVWAPALGERVRPVLDAIHGVRFDLEVPGATVGAGPRASWLHTGPAEAQETLVARGLLPEGWCGDVRRGWYCAGCAERGDQHTTTAPHTIPDLVAVASLGVPAILRAETLARDACAALREYGCPQPERVVWRVGERRETKDRVLAHAWVSGSAEQILSCEGRWYTGSTRDGIVIRKRSWAGDVGAACALWKMGLALDAIDREAVRIVAPPVGGV